MAVDTKSNEKSKQITNESYKSRMREKRDKAFQTKVVIRRLPPSMTEEQFIEQSSPLPDHDYMYFVKADMRLGPHAFSRAYLNFLIPEDIFVFKDKFDDYVFVDNKGNEYPAIVEFSPFQKTPKKRSKKRDAKSGTILEDPDYLKFLESLEKPDDVSLPSAEAYLEEIENREKEMKANNGCLKTTTPLIEFLKARKIEQQKIREEKREERKRKEIEKKRIREEERRKRKAEKEKEKSKDSLSEKEVTDEHEETPVLENSKQPDPVVQVLKNPEREKEQKETVTSQKGKEHFAPSGGYKDKEKYRKEWERVKNKDRQKPQPRVFSNEKERNRYKTRENTTSKEYKSDYRVYSKKRYHESDTSVSKRKGEAETASSQDHSKHETKDPGNARESQRDRKEKAPPAAAEGKRRSDDHPPAKFKAPPRSAAAAAEEYAEDAKDDGGGFDHGKDPRTERRIKNKDRPSLEIYRPGMRRGGGAPQQRNSPQKEVSTSASNSSSPSPTPPLAVKMHKDKCFSKTLDAKPQNK